MRGLRHARSGDPLSPSMKAVLVRMLDWWTKWERWVARLRDGNARQGLLQTHYALEKRGLVRHLRHGEAGSLVPGGVEVSGPGWILTESGAAEAERLKAGGLDPDEIDRKKRRSKARERRRWAR